MKTAYKMAAWLTGAALLVALGAGVSFLTYSQIEEAAAVRKHSNVILAGAEALLSAIKDGETSQRGYLLTGDQAFLDPYLQVHNQIQSQLTELRQLTQVEAVQKHLDALNPLVVAKLAHMSNAIELRRKNKVSAALASVRSGQGRWLMDAIRAEMSSVIKIEQGVLAQREAEFQASMRQLFTIIVITSLLTLMFALAFAWLIYRASQQKIKNLVHLETQHLLDHQMDTNRQLQQANTALQSSKEALHKAAPLQSAIFNSANFSSIATDAKGVIQIFNVGAERMLGYLAADVLNKITPADISDPQEVIARAKTLSVELDTPITPGFEALVFKASRGIEDIYELTYIRKDGSRFPAVVSVTALRDAQDIIIGYLLIGTDNAARKQVEAEKQRLLEIQEETHQQLQQTNLALLVSEEKLTVTLSSIGDAVIAADSEARVSFLNPVAEQLTGWTQAEASGRPVDEVFIIINQETRLPATIPVMETLVLGTTHGLANHTVLIARGGSECAIADSCAPIRDRDNQVIGAVLVFRDVTQEYAVQQALRDNALLLQDKNVELESAKFVAEKANLAKSVFLSQMSHELRTPLNAILGFAQLLEGGSPKPTEAQAVRLHQIIKAGWYLLELINEILDLAIIESGKLALSKEPVSLIEVMRECQAMTEAQAQKHDIHMNFLPFDPSLFANADRTRVKQVLINLLSNAIKYNREHGTVEVKCSATPECIRISIKDSGMGLPPEKLIQLFQPFNRLGQESGSEEGTGIGLVVTKQLIELMGGSIGMESTVGLGSEFWIELVRDVSPQLAAGHTLRAEFTPQAYENAARRTLLYVEDNPANLMLVEQIIARHPHLIMLSARDGNLGVALARAHLPDVILMDINLPGISGIEAMKILRRDPLTAHIPVLALSANAMLRDIEKGLEEGFFRYLTKPIKINEFMSALDDALKFAELGRLAKTALITTNGTEHTQTGKL